MSIVEQRKEMERQVKEFEAKRDEALKSLPAEYGFASIKDLTRALRRVDKSTSVKTETKGKAKDWGIRG